MGDSPGILRSAYLKNVPVYVPAFTDSEMGLDVATWMLRKIHAAARQRARLRPFEARRRRRLQPVPRSPELRQARADQEAARHLHHRRRRAAQLGAAGRALLRHRAAPARRRDGAPALHLRRPHLPGARALGRPLRLHLLGGRELGEVRAAGARAGASPRSTPTRRWPGRCSCGRCSSGRGDSRRFEFRARARAWAVCSTTVGRHALAHPRAGNAPPSAARGGTAIAGLGVGRVRAAGSRGKNGYLDAAHHRGRRDPHDRSVPLLRRRTEGAPPRAFRSGGPARLP